jgi:hypothetical protein
MSTEHPEQAAETSLRRFFTPSTTTANVVSQRVVSDNAVRVFELTLCQETSDALDADVPSLGAVSK